MNTKQKDVKGLLCFKGTQYTTMIKARFTSDEIGETLSLADEKARVMLVVPFESVQELIRETRTSRRTHAH